MSEAYLILENGVVFRGQSFGYAGEAVGKLVFNTAMTGYMETLADPAYEGQIVLQTFPLIGNYGVIPEEFGDVPGHSATPAERSANEVPTHEEAENEVPTHEGPTHEGLTPKGPTQEGSTPKWSAPKGSVYLKGYVVREWCQEPSNFRSEGNLDTFLRRQKTPGLCGVDTRAIMRIIRDSGPMNAMISSVPELSEEQWKTLRNAECRM